MSEPNQLDSGLVAFQEGVWTATDPVRIVGMKLTATMTVLRLDAGMLIYSPLRMTDVRRTAVEALGPVAHLYAPSLTHKDHIGEWAAAFPSARVHAPKKLAKKFPDLRIDRIHGEPEPAFEGVIDEFPIRGFRLEESVLLYRPAQTLLVADLVHNVGRPKGAWTVLYTKAMGFYDRVQMSRMIRWLGFADRRAARRSLDDLLARPFERMVVGHGPPLREGAAGAIAAAYDWLR